MATNERNEATRRHALKLRCCAEAGWCRSWLVLAVSDFLYFNLGRFNVFKL
jgi:hypothetical protein